MDPQSLFQVLRSLQKLFQGFFNGLKASHMEGFTTEARRTNATPQGPLYRYSNSRPKLYYQALKMQGVYLGLFQAWA